MQSLETIRPFSTLQVLIWQMDYLVGVAVSKSFVEKVIFFGILVRDIFKGLMGQCFVLTRVSPDEADSRSILC